jgi:hypothetical protein
MTAPPYPHVPDRHTPDAVILLIRLARANLVQNGAPLDRELLDLAGTLNVRLPAATRVRPDDPRLREPMEGDPDALAQQATITINRCIDHPEFWPTFDRRFKALTSIIEYFTWSHALYKASDIAGEAMRKRVEDEQPRTVDDPHEHYTGVTLFWLASLCTVIRGFEELELSDAAIEALLAKGGPKGSRERLERVRQGLARVQTFTTEEVDFREVFDMDIQWWAMELDEEFARFFGDAMDKGRPATSEWLTRGLVRDDPTVTHPRKRPDDPVAAEERLMARLFEPTAKGERKRHNDWFLETLAGADPGPWVQAVLSLRDSGMLSADEAMHFLYDIVLCSPVAHDDEEVQELSAEKKRIEEANGITDGDVEAAELLPEWNAVCDRENRRLAVVHAAYLRTKGAHEAAALLEQSPDAFEDVAYRGHAEYKRRWPEKIS